MSVSAQRRLPLEFPLLPYQLVVCIQHDEVVDVRRRDEILLPPCPWVYRPSSEENNVRTWNIGCVAVSLERRGSCDPDPSPLEFLSIENSYIIEVASLQLRSLPKISWFLLLLVEEETSLHNHVGSHLKSSMSLTFGGDRSLAFGLGPGHHLKIKHKQIIEVFFPVCSSKYEYFGLVYQNCCMTVSCWRWSYTLWALKPGHCDGVKRM